MRRRYFTENELLIIWLTLTAEMLIKAQADLTKQSKKDTAVNAGKAISQRMSSMSVRDLEGILVDTKEIYSNNEKSKN